MSKYLRRSWETEIRCERTPPAARDGALDLLGLAGPWHLSSTYNYIRHGSICTRFWPKPKPPLELEVIFCVRGVISPLLSNIMLHEVDRQWVVYLFPGRNQQPDLSHDRLGRAERAAVMADANIDAVGGRLESAGTISSCINAAGCTKW